jgi:hypothetical protein
MEENKMEEGEMMPSRDGMRNTSTLHENRPWEKKKERERERERERENENENENCGNHCLSNTLK